MGTLCFAPVADFTSQPYVAELYAPGQVSPSRLTVVFTKRDGSQATVSAGGEISYTTGPRSCSCADFALTGDVCDHMKARERIFRRYARDYRVKTPEVKRPLWAEDIRD